MTAQLDWIEQASQRQQHAAERLQRMVDAKAQSFEIQDYRKRRIAALKRTRPQLVKS